MLIDTNNYMLVLEMDGRYLPVDLAKFTGEVELTVVADAKNKDLKTRVMLIPKGEYEVYKLNRKRLK